MRLERLTLNKFKVFLTYDDLSERGITKEELWQDIPKVHDLFRDVMSEANDELGFIADGPLAVEVFSLPAQAMVVIVTKANESSDQDDYEEGFIEMQVTLDEIDDVFYEFENIEDVIALSSRLYPFGMCEGTLLSFHNKFYVMFTEAEFETMNEQALIALLAEFGTPSTVTVHRVFEYGKVLMETHAMRRLYDIFVK